MIRGTPGFVGERLREAREGRGLSVTELSDLLGVSRMSLSRYESGEQSPRQSALENICRALGLPEAFFLQARTTHRQEQTPVFFRSLSSTTKQARTRARCRYGWFQDLTEYLAQFVDFPVVNFPQFDVPSEPVGITDEMIEELAVKVRRFWGLQDGPISNVTWLLENNGAIVGRQCIDCESLDAFSQWVDDRPFIVVSSDKESAVRSRFDIAHELGHLILHRLLSNKYMNPSSFFGLIEQQAHRFAAAFLFPRKAFLDEVLVPTLDYFESLKARWKVSIGMMIKRAEDLGLLASQEAENLWRNYSRRGWKRREPLDNKITIEQPKLVREAIELLIRERVLNRLDILESVCLQANDVEELAGLTPGYLKDNVSDISALRLRRTQQIGALEPRKQGELLSFDRPPKTPV